MPLELVRTGYHPFPTLQDAGDHRTTMLIMKEAFLVQSGGGLKLISLVCLHNNPACPRPLQQLNLKDGRNKRPDIKGNQ
jgi:hypothetical protein